MAPIFFFLSAEILIIYCDKWSPGRLPWNKAFHPENLSASDKNKATTVGRIWLKFLLTYSIFFHMLLTGWLMCSASLMSPAAVCNRYIRNLGLLISTGQMVAILGEDIFKRIFLNENGWILIEI